MPIYEYICNSCNHELEEMQKFSEAPLVMCPQCGQEKLNRKLSVGAFHLKGGGWYKDGYKGDSNKAPESDKKNATASSKNASSSSSDSKPTSSDSSSSNKPNSSGSASKSNSSSSSTTTKNNAA